MPNQMRCPNPTCRAVVPVCDGRCKQCGRTFTLPEPTRAPGGAPAKIGRYQIRTLLGQGTFGSVYRAFDPHLKRDVALKVLKAEMTASPQAVKRFLREAQAAANLRHAHIVTVFDAGKAGDLYYITSAFIKGRTLASAIPEDGVEPRQAVEWTAQLASALGHAHEQGLVHRDVKPANAMLDEKDLLQLMDFGLAGWTQEEGSRLTQDGAVMGTPLYMSPEQAGGETAAVGPRSDLYSAGVVLYQLLTGRVPFQGGHPAIILRQILDVAPAPPSAFRPGLDAGLEAICLKAIAKDPAQRYQSGAEMAAALRGWIPDTPSSVWGKKTVLPPPVRPGDSTTRSPQKPGVWETKDRHSPAPRAIQSPSVPVGRFSLLGLGMVVLLVAAACTGAAFLLFLSSTPPSTAPLPMPFNTAPKKPAATQPAVVPSTEKPAVPTEPPRLTAPFTATAAKQSQQAWADFLGVPVLQDVNLGGGEVMKLTLLPPGTFTMGSPASEAGHIDAEGPQHPVEISKPFYLGVYAVTKGQFAAFVKDDAYQTEAELAGAKGSWRNPVFLDTKFTQTNDDPVVDITWNDAVKMCTWLIKKTGKTFDLPTEAEWEYACRAGTTTAYYFGDDPKQLGDYAWYGDGNGDHHTHPAGEKKPNAFGFYDMHGNVYQWCIDGFDKDYYYNSPIKDPQVTGNGTLRVLRGGSWGGGGGLCRAAFRFRNGSGGCGSNIGFRVACRSVARTP